MPKSFNVPSDFIEKITKENKKEKEVKEFLDLKSKIDRKFTTSKGRKVFRKCKSFADDNFYYYNLAKKTREGYLEDNKKIDRANSVYMKNIHISRYNNGLKRYREYSKKVNKSSSDLISCNEDETYRIKKLKKEFIALLKPFGLFYLNKWKNKTPTKK